MDSPICTPPIAIRMQNRTNTMNRITLLGLEKNCFMAMAPFFCSLHLQRRDLLQDAVDILRAHLARIGLGTGIRQSRFNDRFLLFHDLFR